MTGHFLPHIKMLPSTKKKKINSLLMKVIAISVGLHVIVGFIAGIIKVATIIAQPDAQFEVPPAVVEEELPVPVNMAIQLQKPIPPQIQNLSTNKVGEIRVSKGSVVLPNMEQNFGPRQ